MTTPYKPIRNLPFIKLPCTHWEYPKRPRYPHQLRPHPRPYRWEEKSSWEVLLTQCWLTLDNDNALQANPPILIPVCTQATTWTFYGDVESAYVRNGDIHYADGRPHGRTTRVAVRVTVCAFLGVDRLSHFLSLNVEAYAMSPLSPRKSMSHSFAREVLFEWIKMGGLYSCLEDANIRGCKCHKVSNTSHEL